MELFYYLHCTLLCLCSASSSYFAATTAQGFYDAIMGPFNAVAGIIHDITGIGNDAVEGVTDTANTISKGTTDTAKTIDKGCN